MTAAHYATTLVAGIALGFILGASLVHRRITSIIKASVFEHDGNGYQVRKVGEA